MSHYIPAQGDVIKTVLDQDNGSAYGDHGYLIVLTSRQYNCTAGLMICCPTHDNILKSHENSDSRKEASVKTISVRWINWKALNLLKIGEISKEHLLEVLDNTMQSFVVE